MWGHLYALLAVIGVPLTFVVMPARAETVTLVRTVPAGASLQYVVGGSVVQSMAVQPGTYRITIESINVPGGVRFRRPRGEVLHPEERRGAGR